LVNRESILKLARRMLGTAYLWGGLTAPASPPQPLISPSTQFGVDCSALVHLSYRGAGVSVPRDSHEQWMKASALKRSELRPADLIFSAKNSDPKKVTHVTLYAGGEQLVEAPQTGMVVRQISFREKYGADFTAVESGQTVGDRVIYFGRLLNN
jgi:cell wall-associated NlpC family hydrolase